jgi:hypothetical protein
MKKAIFLFTILFCFSVNALARNPSPIQEQIEHEEYEVYKALLGEGYQLVINRVTTSGPRIDDVTRKKLSILKPDTLQNFIKRNQKSFELKDEFGIQPKVMLIHYAEVKPFFEMSRVNEFEAANAYKKKFGTFSFHLLSRVGFNKGKNQAVVYLDTNTEICGTCSSGYYVVLSKKNNQWKIKKRVLDYVS